MLFIRLLQLFYRNSLDILGCVSFSFSLFIPWKLETENIATTRNICVSIVYILYECVHVFVAVVCDDSNIKKKNKE